MRGLLGAVVVAAFVTGCASAPKSCATWSITITAEGVRNNLAEPGIPVEVLVRSVDGRVLYRGTTDAAGNLSAEVCAPAAHPPMQIEALLRYAPDAYVGTMASVKPGVTRYCLTLPSRVSQHCN